jgi:hypothetical protein
MTPRLLHLCARATTFPELKAKLIAGCTEINGWDALLVEAERQGLGPLLHYHLHDLGDSCPEHFRRSARLLLLRHRHVNTIYSRVLHEVLELLHKAGIDALVLKGAALSHTIYPEIGLRPMRDIDLLVRKEQSRQAQDILISTGFTESTAPRPEDHFHLPSLHKKVQQVSVCIELHHGLFPDCPPYYRKVDFDTLFDRAIQIDLSGTTAYCPGNEDMLWHIFEHGLHMPLTYEPFKLIAVADIVTLVETKHEEIDWQKMRKLCPNILTALPLLHHLTPWREQILSRFSWKTQPVPAGVGEPFRGWPHLHLRELKGTGFFTILRSTLLPPEWWFTIYYGVEGCWDWCVYRWFSHPRHVFWWVRLYASFLDAEQLPGRKNTIVMRIGRLMGQASALCRKFF